MREGFRIMLMFFIAFNLLFVVWKILPSGPAAATIADISYTNFTNLKTQVPSQVQYKNRSEKLVAALDDPHRLIDLNDFSYIQQQLPCSSHIRGLILVHSATINFGKRQLIRQTWANKRLLQASPLRVIFLLGAVCNAQLQAQLILENAVHRDMVQGSFSDTYRNMTYKHVMALKWFLNSCPNASALIKVDDDVFVNTPQLLKYAQSVGNNLTLDLFDALTLSFFGVSARNSLFCDENLDLNVKRTYRSKWRVSFREYAASRYQPCCLGYAIVYSSETVRRLYVAAQVLPYFWIDDAHITGTVRNLQHIKIEALAKKYLLNFDNFEKLLHHKKNISEIEFLFSSIEIQPINFPSLWQNFPQSQLYDLATPKSEISAVNGTIDNAAVSERNATMVSHYLNSALNKNSLNS